MSNFGIPTDEQLTKINKLSKRTLTKEEVFVFPSKLAGDMIIPGRNVQLTKGLLDVFSDNANKGVSLLLDHSWTSDGLFGMGGRPKIAMPYGRTFDSRFEGATEEGETISLVADHYMVRNVELDGIKTNDLIASIEAGTMFDTSIGFSYEGATCSVCDENYRRCDHYAGRTYEVEIDGVMKNKFCYIKANAPGFLMENSLVFDGAYPGAGVMSKAGDIFENEKGIYQIVDETKDIDPLKPIMATYSERVGLLTMVKKSDHKKVFKGVKIEGEDKEDETLKGGENNMDENLLNALIGIGFTKEEAEALNVGEVTTALNAMVEKFEATPKVGELLVGEALLPEYLSQEQVTEKLGSELSAEKVLELAKEGQDYHAQVIEDAIAMGIKAQGNEFTTETWKNLFATMSTKAIKDVMKTFENQAGKDIPAGRFTKPNPKANQGFNVPDDAFKVGK